MTTIDVNTGGFVGARNFDETIFRTNLEACHTIARELGCATSAASSSSTSSTWRRRPTAKPCCRACQSPRLRTVPALPLNGFSTWVWSEADPQTFARKPQPNPLRTLPVLRGRGRLKTPQTICCEIQREVIREARRYDAQSFRILAAPTSSTSSSTKNRNRWRC